MMFIYAEAFIHWQYRSAAHKSLRMRQGEDLMRRLTEVVNDANRCCPFSFVTDGIQIYLVVSL
jgi:hypothetical protein